jgi:hypothetical protein
VTILYRYIINNYSIQYVWTARNIWLKLAQWFWRSRKCKSLQTDGKTDDGTKAIRIAHLSFQLRWAKNAPRHATDSWLLIDWLIDWLFMVLRPPQEYFTYMEMSPLPVKGYKIWAYARRSGPLSMEGSLSCHTCCDTGPLFFISHSKDRPI